MLKIFTSIFCQIKSEGVPRFNSPLFGALQVLIPCNMKIARFWWEWFFIPCVLFRRSSGSARDLYSICTSSLDVEILFGKIHSNNYIKKFYLKGLTYSTLHSNKYNCYGYLPIFDLCEGKAIPIGSFNKTNLMKIIKHWNNQSNWNIIWIILHKSS